MLTDEEREVGDGRVDDCVECEFVENGARAVPCAEHAVHPKIHCVQERAKRRAHNRRVAYAHAKHMFISSETQSTCSSFQSLKFTYSQSCLTCARMAHVRAGSRRRSRALKTLAETLALSATKPATPVVRALHWTAGARGALRSMPQLQ